MLVYKIDIWESLKESGHTTTRLRKEKLLGENALQYIREGKPVGAKTLNSICKLEGVNFSVSIKEKSF